jgi:hypothetical protein
MARRKKQNEDQPTPENTNESDDTFGLPEIEYEPIKREEQPQKEEAPTESSFSESSQSETSQSSDFSEPVAEPVEDSGGSEYRPTYIEEEEESSNLPKILGILAVLLIIAGGIWYFLVYKPKQDDLAEKAKQEQLAKEEAANKKKLEDEETQRRADEERRKADSLANATPKEGAIETLSERTGRYYVVISSAIDDDLIMDHAKLLSAKGVSSKIIPPFGKVKFFRLAVAEGDTYASAQTTADGLKGEYGDGAWVVKY